MPRFRSNVPNVASNVSPSGYAEFRIGTLSVI